MFQHIKHHLNTQGELIHRPSKLSHKLEALRYLADQIKTGDYTEHKINILLNQWHLFNDPALLRKELYISRLIDPTIDGRAYTKYLI